MIEHSASPAPPRRQPPDIQMLRMVAATLLGPDEPLPRFDDLTKTTERLRGHLQVLIPVVDSAAYARAADYTDLIAVQDALETTRVRLAASPGEGLVSATQHARSLARQLSILCEYYETLTGTAVERPV